MSTLPRPDFPGSHGLEKHYRLVLTQLATTHATGTQIVRAKMTSLDAFFAGKQVEQSPAPPLAFAAVKIKNIPLALEKKSVKH